MMPGDGFVILLPSLSMLRIVNPNYTLAVAIADMNI